MKKLIIVVVALLLLATVPITANAQVDAYSIFGIGHEMTDGGSSHLKYFVGGEFLLKQDTAKGFTLKVRTLYTQVRKSDPKEIQGVEVWEITEQILARKVWNWSVSAGIGVFNEIQEGADLQRLTLKFETGVELFNKLPLMIGIDFIPTDGLGDKEFVYGLLNYKL